MFIGAKHSILVLIEDTHKFLNGANFGEAVEVGLILSKDELEHLLCQVGARHLVLGETRPDCLALRSAFRVGISFSLDLGDEGRVNRIERVEAFGVEFDS